MVAYAIPPPSIPPSQGGKPRAPTRMSGLRNSGLPGRLGPVRFPPRFFKLIRMSAESLGTLLDFLLTKSLHSSLSAHYAWGSPLLSYINYRTVPRGLAARYRELHDVLRCGRLHS